VLSGASTVLRWWRGFFGVGSANPRPIADRHPPHRGCRHTATRGITRLTSSIS
jgi:hypothetical protein